MLKSILVAGAALSLVALPAAADLSSKHGKASKIKVSDADMLPPPGYKGQWWTAPNRCEYSRAGRPGETVWYLIINTAHRGCQTYIVERGFSDIY